MITKGKELDGKKGKGKKVDERNPKEVNVKKGT